MYKGLKKTKPKFHWLNINYHYKSYLQSVYGENLHIRDRFAASNT